MSSEGWRRAFRQVVGSVFSGMAYSVLRDGVLRRYGEQSICQRSEGRKTLLDCLIRERQQGCNISDHAILSMSHDRMAERRRR